MAESAIARRFSQGENLRVALHRQGIASSGSVSTILLETFLEDGGRLPASKAVARGLCKDGEFWLWRKMLVEKGWLVWSEAQQDKGQYFAGKKLMRYINKEIIAQKELATRESVEKVKADLDAKIDSKADRSELEETKAKLEATNRTLAEIAVAVRELQEASIPPDTPRKKRAREAAMARIAIRAAAN